MKRHFKETYGRGPRLRTTEDRASLLARAILVSFALAILAAWATW